MVGDYSKDKWKMNRKKSSKQREKYEFGNIECERDLQLGNDQTTSTKDKDIQCQNHGTVENKAKGHDQITNTRGKDV